jgi:hypothetical protein
MTSTRQANREQKTGHQTAGLIRSNRVDWGPSSAFCSGVRCTFGLGLAPNQEPTTGCNEQRTCKQRHRGPTVSAFEAEAMEARQMKDRGMEMGTTWTAGKAPVLLPLRLPHVVFAAGSGRSPEPNKILTHGLTITVCDLRRPATGTTGKKPLTGWPRTRPSGSPCLLCLCHHSASASGLLTSGVPASPSVTPA